MNRYVNPAALSVWDEQLERQLFDHLFPDQPVPAHLLRPCEQRTPAESAAKVARANRPENFHIPPKGSGRGDVIAPRHERVIPR